MSDSSLLQRSQGNKPSFQNSFNGIVSGTEDPNISVDVGMVLATRGETQNGVGTYYFAVADEVGHAQVVGLAGTANEAGRKVAIVYSGPLSLPTDAWDRVTGGNGGLTPGAVYLVSEAAPGQLIVEGDVVPTVQARVGVALSPTTLLINIEAPFVNP